MKFRAIINSATMGHPERVRPLIGWTMAEYFFRGAPYGILLVVSWELFKPLQYPGTSLNINAILMACLWLLISLILLYWVSRKSYFAAYRDSYNICADGRLKLGEHLRQLSMGYFNSRDPGDIGAYLVSDYANIEMMLSHLLPQFYGAFTMPVVLLISLAFFSWKLALAAALVIPAAWPMSWISNKIIRYFGKKHLHVKIESASRMIEYIQGIRLIRAFNLSGTRFERLEHAFRRLKNESIRLEGGAGPTMILASFVLNSGLTVIMLLGFTMLVSNEISLPVYVMFLILGSRVYEPLFHAMMFMGEMNYMKLGVDRVESLLMTPPLLGGSLTSMPENFTIEFSQVGFCYHNARVIDRINLTIPNQSLTALVGPSGSGKTTLTRLIARFWDVDEGEIRIGGNPIRNYSIETLLSMISIVFQDVYLFNDTIYNNILIGKSTADWDEVMAAAETAHCREFIEALPQGFQTMVGEAGNTLSGGEKQRISIARAILKNAPIILLDEATASLDPENERLIQQAIHDLVKDKTVVVIAHRLNTISQADKIIVIDQGKVTEEGDHFQLLLNRGLYWKLWNEQQRIKGWKF